MIYLNDLLQIKNFENYRIRFVLSWGKDNTQNPLERYRENPDDPVAHYLWKGKKATGFQVGTRVIGCIRLSGDNWLLTHVLEITAIKTPMGLPNSIEEQKNFWYEARVVSEFAKLFGRIIVNYHNTVQNLIRRPEVIIHQMEVVELLSTQLADRDFPGYANVTVTWRQLQQVVQRGNREWQTALQNQKGIYLITDTKTGKQYVGSAYGQQMLWGRWRAYVETGHGGNVELMKLPVSYIQEHFQYAILEIADGKSPDNYILAREKWWKQALRTQEFGYNAN